MILVFLLTLYAAGGVAMFCFVDRGEMKKEVPYGEFPALFSLAAVRKTSLAVFMIFGTGIALVLGGKLILHQFKLRLSVFRLNRVLKGIGFKKRIRLAEGHKITWK